MGTELWLDWNESLSALGPPTNEPRGEGLDGTDWSSGVGFAMDSSSFNGGGDDAAGGE
jgi:hypothetical protein